jgi:starvation-inducible DNA-binding protein
MFNASKELERGSEGSMKFDGATVMPPLFEESRDISRNANAEENTENAKVADALSRFLASTYTLCQKALFYHWNVTGTHFVSLRKLFGEQYESLHKAMDIIAGHLRALGHYVPGTLAEFSDLSAIKEEGEVPHSSQQMIDNLLISHEICSEEAHKVLKTAEEAEDFASADFMFHRMTFHNRAASILREIRV